MPVAKRRVLVLSVLSRHFCPHPSVLRFGLRRPYASRVETELELCVRKCPWQHA
jgi:hypothetical protein